MKYDKKKGWKEVITSTDLTHNSRRAWHTIRKLPNDPTTPNHPCLGNANQVSHQLLINGQGTMPTKQKRPILPFIQDEQYRNGIAALKNKAAGRDDVVVEQLNHLGPNANIWLHKMLNVCFTGNKIWRQSKIIGILKSGKDSAIPKNYRPISFLCHTYKLYERIILNRIAPLVEQRLIKEQTGFSSGVNVLNDHPQSNIPPVIWTLGSNDPL